MSKLDELGVSGNVMRWIGNFQTQRLIRIEILNAVSKFTKARTTLRRCPQMHPLQYDDRRDPNAAIGKTPGTFYLVNADDVNV